MRVASVTVVFNSAQTLARHIGSLLAQTCPLSEIIIVDNGSVDGSADLVRREFPNVTLLALAENEGIGGAQAAGFEYALSKKYDWIWIFDDDSLPQPDALEQLLRVYPLPGGEAVGALACLPVNPESGKEYPGSLWRDHLVPVDPVSAAQPYCFVDTVISSGSLFSRQAVEAVGVPRREFFIDFVDHEYNLRIRRAGFSIAVVRASLMHHAIGKPRLVRLPGRDRLWPEQPPFRHYYMTRNYVTTVLYELLTPRAAMFMAGKLLKQAIGILLLDRHKLRKLYMMASGLADGVGRRLGKRVAPVA